MWHSYNDAFARTPDGTFRELEHLSTVPSETQPRAINAAGMVVGSSLTADHAPSAVMWDAATGAVRDLGTLPGQWSATAMDVNATGTVVGTSGDDAFVWTEAGGMKRLADYGYDATGEKVTDDGWVLGTVELAPVLRRLGDVGSAGPALGSVGHGPGRRRRLVHADVQLRHQQRAPVDALRRGRTGRRGVQLGDAQHPRRTARVVLAPLRPVEPVSPVRRDAVFPALIDAGKEAGESGARSSAQGG